MHNGSDASTVLDGLAPWSTWLPFAEAIVAAPRSHPRRIPLNSDERNAMTPPEPRHALGIARRAITNLDLARGANGPNLHPFHLVTQILTSCLAVVVFPWDEWYDSESDIISLAAGSHGWTVDDRTGSGGSDNLRYLRHAVAHGGIRIPDTSRDPSVVTIYFESRPDPGSDVNWEASILADDLDLYLRKLFNLLDDRFG